MENLPSSEVIKIDASCLKDVKIEKDMEGSFIYFNNHYIVALIILLGIFGIQLYYGLPVGDVIDMDNFTYKYASYAAGGNYFGILT
jgi:hypothetical protein